MKAAIVQARYASTRLPGKVLEDLAGRSVLSHVLARCSATRGIDLVCCAIPDTPEADRVAEEAVLCGATVVRGSENDVLNRFTVAADEIGATVIMRVTSDCPLTDPLVNTQVLELAASMNADYACNNMPPKWPHGLDCEVFTAEALARADREATSSQEREHVTPWLRNQPDIRRAILPGPGGNALNQRWTLDYPEDLAFFRAVYAHLPPETMMPTYTEIYALLEKYPEIAIINAGRHNSNRIQTPAREARKQ